MNIQRLPKGYYAVQSGLEATCPTTFLFRGISYTAQPGVNLFSSLADAGSHACEIPDTVLEGLDYDRFTTPVLLFSSGTHSIDSFEFDRSLTLLGNGACINPNTTGTTPLDPPSLTPARRENESILKGSFWRGTMSVNNPAAETLIFDGFSSLSSRFADKRTHGGSCYISFRNIIQVSPCVHTLYTFAPTAANGGLNREVLFQNIRLTDFDDGDYGANFALINARKAVFEGLCYHNTNQFFGLTDYSRTRSNCDPNAQTTEYIFRNSYFKNANGLLGIATSCNDAGERAVNMTVENCIFLDASAKDNAVLQPQLSNTVSTLRVRDSIFADTRINAGPAILIHGPGQNVSLENCSFEGFSGDWKNKAPAPTDAPDFIENAVSDWTTHTGDPHTVSGSDFWDFSRMDRLYENCTPYYGDLHVHTNCGGTSDGKVPMTDWPTFMDEKKVDFAAVVDHRQMRGFFLPEWDSNRFIIGTEPAMLIGSGLNALRIGLNELHYNMLFPHKYGLAMVLANFPEYKFHGDELTGSFTYPTVSMERFREICAYVQSIGGIFVHAHPKQMLVSADPLDYYYGEHSYIETIYGNVYSYATRQNYKLWTDLLALGKHVYASGGSDTHGDITNTALATFYTSEQSGDAFFRRMHSADYTTGALGIKMCIDGHPMGSEIEYREGMTLTIRVDDFFENEWRPDTVYVLRIITDQGIAYCSEFNGTKPQQTVLHVQKRAFYRAEVYDMTHDNIVAIGNPIWLS